MKFIQHIPNFVSGYEPFEMEGSLEEILDKVKQNSYKKDFYQFSYTEGGRKGLEYCLMAEYEDGKVWWVKGFLSEKPDLPVWKPNENKRER